MNNVLFHGYAGPKAIELCRLIANLSQKCFTTDKDVLSQENQSNNIAEEEIDSLIVAFPDDLNLKTPQEASEKLLSQTFSVVKSFVQARIKKKFGQIIFLVDARANGMPYATDKSKDENSLNPQQILSLAAQGGLIGFAKTIAKEYSKRGIINNVLYIDWHNIPLNEVATRIDTLFKDNTNLNGQVFALDGGKWL